MKVSMMGLKKIRLNNLDKDYPAQDILFKTGQVKQYGSGVYAYDNIPLRVQDNIENIIKKHFDQIGSVEVQMPILQQKELWERSNRYQKYVDDGVMLTVDTKKGVYCLAPTAEEAITAFVENRVTSYRQLPVSFYQIGPKFRNELRNRGYLYRGKEFLMFDLYSFDIDEASMIDSYNKFKQCYFDIFKELDLELVAVAALNGSIGGSCSEEMMIICPTGEDTILYDENLKIGLNKEVMEKEDYQSYLKDNYGINDVTFFKEHKALELGHIFALGTKYSSSMNIKYIDSVNNEMPFQMGCYGIGVSRILGAIYENNIIKEGDTVVGYSLPLSVTPYYAHIVYNNNRMYDAVDLYNKFMDNNIPVILDDTNSSIGEKIRTAKILGIPYVIVLGNNAICEIEKTKDGKKVALTYDECFDKIKDMSINKKDIL